MKKKYALLGLSSFAIASLALLPTILSSSYGKVLIEKGGSYILPGSLEIQELSLSWFGESSIQGIEYKEKNRTFSCKHISLKGTLLPFFPVQEITFENPSISLGSETTYKENPFYSSSFVPPMPQASVIKPIQTLSWKGGSFITPFVSFQEAEGSLRQKEKKESSLTLKMDSIANGKQGSIFVEGLLTNKTLLIQTNIQSLPIEGASSFLRLLKIAPPVSLESLFGASISLVSDINLSEKDASGSFSLSSDLMQSKIFFASDKGLVSITKPASIKLFIPPPLIHKFSSLPLHTPLGLSLEVSSFSAPLDSKAFWTEMAFSLKGSSDPYELLPGINAKLSYTASSPSLASLASVDTTLSFRSKKGSSDISFKVSVEELFSLCKVEGELLIDKTSPLLLALLLDQPLFGALGDWVEGRVAFEGSKAALNGSLVMHSPLFSLNSLPFSWKEGVFQLDDKASFSYTLNEETLSLVKEFPFKLKKNSSLELEIDEFQYSSLGLKLRSSLSLGPLFFEEGFFPKVDIGLSSLWEKKNSDLSLKKPVEGTCMLHNVGEIGFTIPNANVPLNGSLDSLSFKVLGKSPSLLLKSRKIHLENNECSFSFLGKKDLISIFFLSSLDGGKVDLTADIKNLQETVPLAISSSFSLESIPAKYTTYLLQENGSLAPFLGKSFSFKGKGSYQGEQKSMNFSLESPLLSLKGAFKKDEKGLSLEKGPLLLDMTLVDEGHTALHTLLRKDLPSFTLNSPTKIKGRLKEFSFPRKFSFEDLLIEGSFENKQATFIDEKTKRTLKLQNTSCHLEKNRSEAPFSWHLATEVEKRGSFAANGTFDNKGSLCMETTGSQMPAAALDIFYPIQKDFFTTLLGEEFRLSAFASLEKGSGPISFSLFSPKTSCTFEGIAKEGTLYLEKPGEIKLNFSEETSSLFLKNHHTPLKTAHTLKPISIIVSPEGFSLPIHPLSIDKLNASSITLDVGKVECKGDEDLDLTFQLFRSKETSKAELYLWFTPFSLQIQNGIIYVKRTEVLVNDKYQCALWGNINLPDDLVNMTLGITASALKKSLSLRGLPKDYVLKIPIRGSLNDFNVDSAYASSKITALVLWKNKVVQKSLGPFGEILNQVIPPPGGDGKTPPPRPPFPWEKY